MEVVDRGVGWKKKRQKKERGRGVGNITGELFGGGMPLTGTNSNPNRKLAAENGCYFLLLYKMTNLIENQIKG